MASTSISSTWPYVAAAPRATAQRRRGPGRVAFGGLVALTLVAIFAPQEWVPALADARPGLIATAVGVIAVVLERLKRGERLVPRERELYVIIGLAAWALVTAPLSYWPGGSLAMLFDFAAKSFVVFWLVVQVVTTPDRHWRICWAVVLLTFPAAEAGIENFVNGFMMAGSDRILGYRAGITANPNDHALVMNLVLPLAVALLVASRRPAVRLVLVGLIATFVASTVVTFSRGGFIQLAMIVVVYLVKLWRQGRRGWAAAAVVLACLAFPALPGRYVTRITTMGDIEADASGSAQERYRDLGAAVRYFVAHPIVGAGIGQAALAMNVERGATWRVVHNVYLEYGVELGVPGLTLFLMLLLFTLQNAARARRAALRLGDRRLFSIAEGVQVSLLGFVAAAPFHPGGYNFLFFYIAGLALAIRRLGTERLAQAGQREDPAPDADGHR